VSAELPDMSAKLPDVSAKPSLLIGKPSLIHPKNIHPKNCHFALANSKFECIIDSSCPAVRATEVFVWRRNLPISMKGATR
jgi:hypothetical protein